MGGEKVKKKLLLFLFFSLFALLLTGCYNYHELENLAIVTGLSIDKKDNQYVIGVLVANSKKQEASSKEGQSQTIVYEGKGNSVMEAFYNIDLESPKQLYIGHLAVVVIDENIAKNEIEKISDILIRSPESRKNFYVVIARDAKAADVLKITSPLESYPSQNVSMNLKNTSTYQGISTDLTYSEFIASMLTPGINPTLPTIKISGSVKEGEKQQNLESSAPETKLQLGTLAIFRNTNLLGYVSEDESRIINILNRRTSYSLESIKYKDNNIVFHLSNFKIKRQATLKDNKPIIDITFQATAAINEINTNANLSDPKTISDINQLLEDKTKQQILNTIHMTQNEFQSDIFGFGNLFYQKYPDYFSKIELQWDEEEYANIKINVNVDIDLETKGSLEQTIRREMYGKTTK